MFVYKAYVEKILVDFFILVIFPNINFEKTSIWKMFVYKVYVEKILVDFLVFIDFSYY